MRGVRARAYRHDLFAETVAALLFRLKGHRIVARRYRSPVGEINPVVQKSNRLVFVESKRRRTTEDTAWMLPAKQGRRIVRVRNTGSRVIPTS
jgi:putative endonuclease